VKQVFRCFGYDLLSTDYAQEFLPSHHLSRVFKRLQIKCVLDVGANLGQYRDFLREKVGFDGSILSFEPIPSHVEILKAKAKDDKQWTVYDFALGAEGGNSEINVMQGGELSSFLSPSETSPAMTVKSRVMVTVRTLNSIAYLVEEICPIQFTYLKLDTQGFDLNVIRGGTQVLNRIPALQAEASLLPIYQGMPGFLDIYEHLTHLGFDLSGMFPVFRDDFLRVREFDCVFVNSRALGASVTSGS